MNQNSPSGRRANSLGVHSIDHFAVEVPDLEAARTFYTLFGLDVRDVALHLADQVTDRARHFGKALRADDHQGHRADERQLVEAEINHDLVLASTSTVFASADF